MDAQIKGILFKAGMEVEIEKGPNEITAYANIGKILFGPDEVIIHFGLRNIDEPNKAVGIAKIYVSSAHAKRLTEALNQALKQVEEIFGEITADPVKKLPPDKIQILQDIKK